MNRVSRPHGTELLAALAIALGVSVLTGCGGSSPGGEPDSGLRTLNDTMARDALPPIALKSAGPPAPMPATFDVADLAERVKPTVVNITTLQRVSAPTMGHPFDLMIPGGPGGEDMPTPEREGAGTGFVIDPNGYVVTNEHVVRDADEVKVRMSDEREFSAEVVGRDTRLDIALLKLSGAQKLPSVTLGSSETLRVGEHVLAVGNPFGLGHTVTLGIVSAKARAIGAGPYDDFIQTDAAINPGNSGGPLFNWRGDVVGINTAIRPRANTIGFAIPIDAVRDVVEQLRSQGHVVRGKLGLVFQPISSDLAKALKIDGTSGALVSEIEPQGSAARAGIRPGDVIVAVNGAAIRHAEELPRNVAKNRPGTSIAISLVREGRKMDVKASLDTLEDDAGRDGPARKVDPSSQAPSDNKLGIRVRNAKGGGVLVEGMLPTSPLKEIHPGDVVVEIGGKPVADVDAFQRILEKATPGGTILAKVRRGDSARYAPLLVPQ